MNIYVGNLSLQVTEDELRQLFIIFGEVTSVITMDNKYIGNRFHIYAENQTTEEFFSALLVKNPFDHPTETILRKFSEHSDNVKYSLYRPGKETAEDSFKIAKSFVDTTKLTEEEAG